VEALGKHAHEGQSPVEDSAWKNAMPRTRDYNLYWGDTHCQYPPHIASEDEWPALVERSVAAATQYLDFMPLVFYPALHLASAEGMPHVESRGWLDAFEPYWQTITALAKKYYRPGKFVTFPGYEWIGNRTRWGDHNVVYRHDDQPLDLAMHIDDLYANLRRRGGIAIPHHSGYAPGHRSKDWSHFDEALSPFAEIFSGHGCSEGEGSPVPMARNTIMGPRVTGNTIQDGLAQGCRFGIIASQDGWPFAGRHGAGLMACYAEELTRESLWEAFLARRVYGVTGDRIKLDSRINNRSMGEAFEGSGNLRVRASAVGTQAIDRIELIKDNRVVATHCHQGTWRNPARGTVRVKLQIEHGWGLSTSPRESVVAKNWDALVKTRGAQILSVEGRFSRLGQEIVRQTKTTCAYRLTTYGRDSTESVVLEIEGPVDSRVVLKCGSHSEAFTLAELMGASLVLSDREETDVRLKEQYGLDASQYDTVEDKLYGCSYKTKLHQAIPEAGYTAALKFADVAPKRGSSFYYVRVSQVNGQYAWSSPIWVDARKA